MEDGDVRDSKWRQKLNEQSNQIAFALLGKQLAVPDRYARSFQMPITTRRWGWLESRSVGHGGNPKQFGPGHVPRTAEWNSSTYPNSNLRPRRHTRLARPARDEVRQQQAQGESR